LPSVSSLAEASEFLASAHADGRQLRIGEDVTTEGLAAILEHEAGDLTCTVEAGIRLSALNVALARHGQRLSLDPPGDPTVGALLALNASGPLRHRFGAPRDLVLGVTLVLADGTIASSGGKVVKNVAGYDLARLVCGSHGRLALIGRASFRLHPRPRATRTLVVETDDPASAVSALRRSQLEPSALDVLHPGRLAVLFEGAERAVESQLARARTLVGGAEADAGIWQESRARQGAAEGRMGFEPGRLADVLGDLSEAVVRPAAGLAYTSRPRPRDTVSSGDPASTASLERLLARLEAELDPKGVLA
jgi:glycolate oxidase FAD binding subunit